MSSNPEDLKLQKLAVATQLRTGAASAAALRDTTGRTYVGIPVALGALEVDAVEAVLVIAKASQIQGVEAIVVAGSLPSPFTLELIYENYPDAAVFHSSAESELISLSR